VDRAWPSADRFRLTGPSVRLDPRVHAVRRDIADIALADRVFAPHYARALRCRCVAPAATMHARADAASTAVSQLLHGEEFAVIDAAGGWAWGYSAHDGYVGYVREDALGEVEQPSHVVTAATALVFADPDIKSAIVAHWPMGARFSGQVADQFVAAGAGYVHARHVASLAAAPDDPVTVAERLIGAPYSWGGRGAGGIDCSGLVQLALGVCGMAVPRDSDLQRAEIGREIAADEPLHRGDLIFFPGHVGIMVDDSRMIHANAFWMGVTIERLDEVVARVAAAEAEPILARRRIET
jgi:cell wall-associated NlpC family hydrolase